MSFLNHKIIEEYAENMVEDLNIKVRDIHQPTRELSVKSTKSLHSSCNDHRT